MGLNHPDWESGAQIARREREERIQRMRKQNEEEERIRKQKEETLDDDDEGQNRQVKRQKPSSANYNNLLPPPPGWLDCPAIGQELLGFLIPSKVPLCDSYQTLSGKKYSFTQVLRFLGRKQLGLVIDLTNSTRYYNPYNECTKEGIKHVKIPCKGRDSVPDNKSVNEFFYEVHRFQKKQPKKHVLVHCTHGHNRTGYMIVHYLMRSQQPHMSVTSAIKQFAEARPPGIYKPEYIDALYDFYHEKKPGPVLVSIPEWKKRSCSDDDEEEEDRPSAPPQPVVDVSIMSNDDVLGDDIPAGQETAMQQFCLRKIPKSSSRPGNYFPGSHPVSLDRKNLLFLRQFYYHATWKADGTRYMMLITKDGCYLVDRKFRFRRVQMRFPCVTANSHHHNTLLDGEMVIDTVPDSGEKERRFLIYDMMAVNSLSIVDSPFFERWEKIEREVIEPRNSERKQNLDYRYDSEPFRVRRKDFWTLSSVETILKHFIPKLSHEADGLVFQGWNDHYAPGPHKYLLKWKYPKMNSVDFLFEMIGDRQSLFLLEHGKKKAMDRRVVFPDGSNASDYAGKIVECFWDSERNAWVFMRVRVDKGTPNDFKTYEKVMMSIKDNITEEVLLNKINEIIRLPMYAADHERQNKISKARPKR